eukprot:1154584-Pelagomonas_calceolata.AAC.1
MSKLPRRSGGRRRQRGQGSTRDDLQVLVYACTSAALEQYNDQLHTKKASHTFVRMLIPDRQDLQACTSDFADAEQKFVQFSVISNFIGLHSCPDDTCIMSHQESRSEWVS